MFDQQSQSARVPSPLNPYHMKTQMFELQYITQQTQLVWPVACLTRANQVIPVPFKGKDTQLSRLEFIPVTC